MFDFEKLDVYQKAKNFNRKIRPCLELIPVDDRALKDQLRRASLSIMLNNSRRFKPV
ncbi:MAG TPA: four helix bundle protein [Bacteroidia bacterium]|nr:four helix bundle protein [Bacteroidia bacterium]